MSLWTVIIFIHLRFVLKIILIMPLTFPAIQSNPIVVSTTTSAVALCKDIRLQRGRFCTRSLASYIPRSCEDRSHECFSSQLCTTGPVVARLVLLQISGALCFWCVCSSVCACACYSMCMLRWTHSLPRLLSTSSYFRFCCH